MLNNETNEANKELVQVKAPPGGGKGTFETETHL